MKSSVAKSKFGKWSFSAVLAAFLGSGCSATNELEKHPANAKIQNEITEIINGLPSHADFVKQYCGTTEAAWG